MNPKKLRMCQWRCYLVSLNIEPPGFRLLLFFKNYRNLGIQGRFKKFYFSEVCPCSRNGCQQKFLGKNTRAWRWGWRLWSDDAVSSVSVDGSFRCRTCQLRPRLKDEPIFLYFIKRPSLVLKRLTKLGCFEQTTNNMEFRFQFRLGWFSIINNLIVI